MSNRCGHTVVDREGIEQPCDRPATGWRWYQDVEHEDTLDAACDWHENGGGALIAQALETERALARAEAALRDMEIERNMLRITTRGLTDSLEAGDACGAAGCRALAERDEAVAKVARVVALVTDWEAAHTHLGIERGNWGPSSSSLRVALAGPSPAAEGGEADMRRAWREGWIVGNRWAFSDADVDAIEANPYRDTPATEGGESS